MGKRGKKSSAELATVTPITAIRRPKCPASLTAEESREWVAIVGRLPAEWFPRETHAMLAQYCRHVVTSRRVSDLIENHIKGETITTQWIEDYDRLLKMQEREGRAMSALATRMRITQQATYSKDKGKGGPQEPPPHLA